MNEYNSALSSTFCYYLHQKVNQLQYVYLYPCLIQMEHVRHFWFPDYPCSFTCGPVFWFDTLSNSSYKVGLDQNWDNGDNKPCIIIGACYIGVTSTRATLPMGVMDDDGLSVCRTGVWAFTVRGSTSCSRSSFISHLLLLNIVANLALMLSKFVSHGNLSVASSNIESASHLAKSSSAIFLSRILMQSWEVVDVNNFTIR